MSLYYQNTQTSYLNEPQLFTPPRIRKANHDAVTNEATIAVELANKYILPLYDWQQDVLTTWLSLNDEGKYAHPTCGLILPRQNGKSKGVIAARMLSGAVLYGEKIRYSSHRVDSMMEMWDIFLGILGDPRTAYKEFPELNAMVKRVSLVNGHRYFEFTNGGALYFTARSTGAGRGNTVDVNIYDEAQYMTEAQSASSKFGQSAAPRGNPQTIYIGTPPDYIESTGEVFGRIRQNAINGISTIAWHEWSVAEVGDVSDKERWYATNPSLGLSLLLSAVEDEYNETSEETFARERLAYWAEVETNIGVNRTLWDETILDDAYDSDDVFFLGIKFSPNGKQVSVSAVTLKPDGTTYGELAINEVEKSGITWLFDRIVEQSENIAGVAIDGKSGAGELAFKLLHDKLPDGKKIHKDAVKVMSTQDVIVASTMLNSSLEEKTLTHYRDKNLDISAHKATKRKIGNDGYGFGGDSIPLESMAIANWLARTSDRQSLLVRKTRKEAYRR